MEKIKLASITIDYRWFELYKVDDKMWQLIDMDDNLRHIKKCSKIVYIRYGQWDGKTKNTEEGEVPLYEWVTGHVPLITRS